MKKNVVVIFGGKSTEHEISILSAMQVLENIDIAMYEVTPIYIDKQGKWWTGKKLLNINTYKNFKTKSLCEVSILPTCNNLYIKKFGMYKKQKQIDCAFIIMHGNNGEDGTIQGLMELSNIPYTSCGVLASSVGMSKLLQKNIFESIGIEVVPYTFLTKEDYLKSNKKPKLENLDYPIIVKPNSLGSSIGITVCKKQKDFLKALELAFKFDDIVLIEKFIENLREVNVSVMGYKDDVKLSETEEPLTKHEFLDFESKYLTGSKGSKVRTTGSKQNGLQNLTRKIPAKIEPLTKQLIYDYATTIFKYLDCKGVIRIDFILDENKKVYVNEINTIPGSLAYYLWQAQNIDFKTQLNMLYEIAQKDYKLRQEKITTFENHVLK